MLQPVEEYYDEVIAAQSIARGQILFSEKPVVTFPNIHFDTKASTSFNDLLDMEVFRTKENPGVNYFYGDVLDDVNKLDQRPNIPQVCFGCYGIRKNGVTWRCKSCGLPLCHEACEVAEGHQNLECRFIQTTCKEISSAYHSTESMYVDIATLRAILVSSVDMDRILNLNNHSRVCNFRGSANYNVLLRQGDFKSIFPLSVAAARDVELVDKVFCVIEALSMTFRKSQRRLYLGAASLQHSCIPNCTLTLFNQEENNDAIAIITSEFINKGDRITLDVVRKPLFIGIENRRTLLQKSYVFNCSCNYCLDPKTLATYVNAIRCDLCSFYLLPHKTKEMPPFTLLWKCEDSNCPSQKSGQEVQDFLNSTALEIKGFPLKHTNIAKFLTLKSVLLDKLHPNHYLILAIQGIVAKLAYQPYGRAWGGMKAITNLKSLNVKAERDYGLILQYYTQLLRFFRTSYTIERALILRNIFYVEILLVYQNFRNIKLNRPQHLIHLRLQINRLEESGKSFIKHNPARTLNGEDSLRIVELFQAAIRVAGNLVASRPDSTLRVSSDSSQVKLQNLLRPIVDFICKINPAHENYVI